MPMRVSVDFNTMMVDPEERVSINTGIHQDLLEHLRPGLLVLLCDETLEVEAIAEFDEEHRRWLARPNWSTSRDLPYPESSAGS